MSAIDPWLTGLSLLAALTAVSYWLFWDMQKANAQRGTAKTSRIERQVGVHHWCVAAFGDDHARSIEQRGIRMVEEAIEAAQAAGCKPEMVHKLVDFIFAKEPGNLAQEIGGVGVTLLALAQAATVDADAEESREFARVLSLPLEHFAKRNAVKNEAGFNVCGYSQMRCYECDKITKWLAPDGRCTTCTRCTAEEIF